MKELTIKEKAKRYDEAYKVAKNIHIFSSDLVEIKRMEEIFPELKEESEGERIRKRICKLLWDNAPYEEAQEYIAWLEKQGAQKSVIEMKTPEESLGIDSNTYNKIVDECIYGEQKSTNKSEPTDYNSIDPHFFKTTDNVESKFHDGDWITNGDYTWKIVEVKPLDYILQSQDGNIIVDTISYVDEQFHSFTIQDAKPGDVFVNQNGEMPFIFKECKNNHIYCYCGYTNRKDIFFDRFVDSEGEELHWLNLYHEQAYPATKEQRDTLMKAMADAGYTFDFKKKKLKKIEQKLAWSKEDEVKINRIVACLENLNVADNDILLKDVDWLKSLKERVENEKDKHQ